MIFQLTMRFWNWHSPSELTSSSSFAINFVEYQLHSAKPSKLDSALGFASVDCRLPPFATWDSSAETCHNAVIS